MRVFVPALLVMASMPVYPRVLPVDAPRVVIQSIDCAAAQHDANSIAQELGFSAARITCMGGTARATLYGTSAPRATPMPNLIAYSVPEPRSVSPPVVATTFRVPSDIPWVSTAGTIVAYVKTDALLLTVPTNNLLATAFAFENAGISRDDMITQPSSDNEKELFVRVHPLNISQVLKIDRIARRLHSYAREQTAFIRDCDSRIASLSGLALGVARDRANLMARAARTGLDRPLGVVDPGGYVVNARCGLGADATVQQLADAVNASPDLRFANGGLHAAIVRSIHVAWRLKLSPNPAGQPWYEVPDFKGIWYGTVQRPAFLADGQRAHTDGLSPPNVIIPDRVFIRIPDWLYGALQNSRYKTDISLEVAPLQPAIVLHAATLGKFERSVANFQEYVARLGAQAGKHADLQFYYSRDDCRPATDAALFRATSDAIAGLHGKPFRYLQETAVFIPGDVPCEYEPVGDDVVSISNPRPGAAAASVVVGY